MTVILVHNENAKGDCFWPGRPGLQIICVKLRMHRDAQMMTVMS